MSANNTYADESALLLRMLETEGFRFVLVQFNHYSLRTQLIEDIAQKFPDRRTQQIDVATADYRSLVDTFYALERGVLFIDNFETVLDNSGLYTGLNLRRDKLAQYPIAMIGFITPSANEAWGREMMKKMPDLWSFRSLVLELRKELEVAEIFDFKSGLANSSIGGNTREEKLKALVDIKEYEARMPEMADFLRLNVYQQIFDLQIDTGQYDEALKTTEQVLNFNLDRFYATDWLIKKGDVLRTIGRNGEALNAFQQALKLASSTPLNMDLQSLANNRIGHVFYDSGNYEKAIGFSQAALNAEEALLEEQPNDIRLKKMWRYIIKP